MQGVHPGYTYGVFLVNIQNSFIRVGVCIGDKSEIQFSELRCWAKPESPHTVIKEDHGCLDTEAQRTGQKLLKCPGVRVVTEVCLGQSSPLGMCRVPRALGEEKGCGTDSRQ